MKELSLCELTESIIELAREAGHKILEIYETEFDIQHKDDRTPLTEADMAAHRIIDDGLAKLTPDIPVLSEESKDIPFSERSAWSRYWLVDPLDGTREFIKRNGEFTVNIALIEGHDAIAGVVYAPVLRLCYYACKGDGAFKVIDDGTPEPIHVRKWHGGTVTVAGSRSHRGSTLDAYLDNLADYDIISMGSALKSCLVAEGRADIYPRLGPTSEWDTAAAQIVVEEAGGQITKTNMERMRYNTKESLLNPHFFVFGADHDWSQYLEKK